MRLSKETMRVAYRREQEIAERGDGTASSEGHIYPPFLQQYAAPSTPHNPNPLSVL